jgi:hypothetical protein
VTLQVATTLPQDAVALSSSPTGTFDTGLNAMVWNLGLPSGQSTDLLLTFRVPAAANTYEARTVVSTASNNGATPYGDPISQAFSVAARAAAFDTVSQSLNALVLANKQDQKARDSAVALVQAAQSDMAQQTASGYDAAVVALAQAAGLAGGLPGDTTAIRSRLDDLMHEAQWRWWQATTH